jgi:hypothetical protein
MAECKEVAANAVATGNSAPQAAESAADVAGMSEQQEPVKVRLHKDYRIHSVNGAEGSVIAIQPKTVFKTEWKEGDPIVDEAVRLPPSGEYQLSDPATHTAVENGELELLKHNLKESRAQIKKLHKQAESGAGNEG